MLEGMDEGQEVERLARRLFSRSLYVYHLDTGSSGGCNQEVDSLAGPDYDLDRFGVVFVDDPSSADVLLVTGVVCRPLATTLWDAFAAAPRPLAVVAVGACAISGGVFALSYGSAGPVDAHVPVDVYVPGCPPHPTQIIHGLRLALEKIASRAATA
jgi:Ni,Fe-hydrogenase III small subunit